MRYTDTGQPIDRATRNLLVRTYEDDEPFLPQDRKDRLKTYSFGGFSDESTSAGDEQLRDEQLSAKMDTEETEPEPETKAALSDCAPG